MSITGTGPYPRRPRARSVQVISPGISLPFQDTRPYVQTVASPLHGALPGVRGVQVKASGSCENSQQGPSTKTAHRKPGIRHVQPVPLPGSAVSLRHRHDEVLVKARLPRSIPNRQKERVRERVAGSPFLASQGKPTMLLRNEG
ncbi:hypothetical protein ColLi_12104 [Colletotrichum liriopes]|uniref:Uncharacterized protein n=1 Tax=Colletotrichum liriopes TaxID=708192 RepID=A0AA37GXS0_9PEZI|nr:hypothetical protein ColLi_12104 [Colletotrichum liriopes]